MMLNKTLGYFCVFALLSMTALTSFAEQSDMGQVIQIHTRLHSFIGKPTWLLVIRDLDHGENIPYVFEITRGQNFWIAMTYSRHYLISISNLQIETYREADNGFRNYKINDFCHLESRGRIIRNQSLYITIDGDLSADSSTYHCHVSRYADSQFSIYQPEMEE
jgi:hypothetical protein